MSFLFFLEFSQKVSFVKNYAIFEVDDVIFGRPRRRAVLAILAALGRLNFVSGFIQTKLSFYLMSQSRPALQNYDVLF